MKERKKMKNYCTATSGEELCWVWTVCTIQRPCDVCEACEKNVIAFFETPCNENLSSLLLNQTMLPRFVKEYKGRAY